MDLTVKVPAETPPAAGFGRASALLYGMVIFLSAFLLFQVQPLIAKVLLPWFGGTSAVWSACMLFFQATLLLGYLYAHWLHERLGPRRQALVHSVILLGSLAALPILPNPAWLRAATANPSLRILALLAATVGLPYFLLSTTSPLLQAWYARTHRGAVPYRLFALSNFASMAALLSYPVLVEPNLSTRTQALAWSVGYGCFVLLCGFCAWTASRGKLAVRVAEEGCAPPPPGWPRRLLWMALAACASVLLLSVTTFLTQDVASIPFLWVLPLCAYLLTFILCFESPKLYHRAVFLPQLALALGALAWLQWPGISKPAMALTIAIAAAALFVLCMVCHGEMARLKPHSRHLTMFYVMVSLGGALGGVFVGLIAPNLFNAYHEFPIGLGACAALAAVVLWLDRSAWMRGRWGRAGAALLPVAVSAYLVCLGIGARKGLEDCRVAVRNFYGQLRVVDEGEANDPEAFRKLLHGVINHGQQMLYGGQRRLPVSYFCPETGIGRAMRSLQAGVPARIGILGLGCGTLAAYGRAGDTFRIYEINPLVVDLARREFSYLSDTPARVEVALGDGRLTLEQEPSQRFDLLVMDAFSGDSVPVHLITREAFATYLRHLKPNGLLAVNISNRYLDLRPVIERCASHFGRRVYLYEFSPEESDTTCFDCTWALVIPPAAVDTMTPELKAGEIEPAHTGFRIWTDDFSNMLRILK